MSILVVGSVALDDIEAPSGRRTGTLGGACTYFSTVASLYARVHMVGVVGTDFPREHIGFLESRGIDLTGLQVVEGRTFSWAGRYDDALGDAETLDTQLNVFADFHPVIPENLRDAEYLFLANIDPDLQVEVLDQLRAPRLTALDSMNFWIATKRDALTRALSRVDVVLLNETEVRMYTEESNLLEGAAKILGMGPKALVVKRGEYGSMLVTKGTNVRESLFAVPAYPVRNVVDPTGAGDTFAAGFMGYLAQSGDLTSLSLRRAIVHGTVVASYTVQDFGIGRLRDLTARDIEERYEDFRHLTHFQRQPETRALQQPL